MRAEKKKITDTPWTSFTIVSPRAICWNRFYCCFVVSFVFFFLREKSVENCWAGGGGGRGAFFFYVDFDHTSVGCFGELCVCPCDSKGFGMFFCCCCVGCVCLLIVLPGVVFQAKRSIGIVCVCYFKGLRGSVYVCVCDFNGEIVGIMLFPIKEWTDSTRSEYPHEIALAAKFPFCQRWNLSSRASAGLTENCRIISLQRGHPNSPIVSDVDVESQDSSPGGNSSGSRQSPEIHARIQPWSGHVCLSSVEPGLLLVSSISLLAGLLKKKKRLYFEKHFQTLIPFLLGREYTKNKNIKRFFVFCFLTC